jgi:protease-4
MKTAGGNKGMGDPFSPENPEQEKIWQGMLDDIHQQFITAVQTGRGKRLDAVKNPDLFSGRVYTGNEAKKVGLIDDFGSTYSVAREIIKAPEMVDYTVEDDFSKTFGRKFGAEVKQGIKSFDEFSW